jgi:Ni,Fe-hydrogenase I cytochrome b subunit
LQFPLSFADITLWLAITSIILLATSELISPYYGRTNLLVEKGRLRAVALTVGIIFILAILAQIYFLAPF